MRKSDLALSLLKINFHFWIWFPLFFPKTLLAGMDNMYTDKPFLQHYSIRYNYSQREGKLLKAFTDRNGYIQVLSENGLLRPRNGQFLFPGLLVPDLQDKSLSDKKVTDLTVYQNQMVYLTDQTISEVLPPDELPLSRHNSNRFRLDDQGEGQAEYSAGDIWLLPYWMGRYLGVISDPLK